MKQSNVINVTSNDHGIPFNSFEDETYCEDFAETINYEEAFNSFEDETRLFWPYVSDGVPYVFQFLWGWNWTRSGEIQTRDNSFNSFEDETEIQVICSIIHYSLSIPLRMKPFMSWLVQAFSKHSFNSFEDETFSSHYPSSLLTIPLSIPLRMKHLSEKTVVIHVQNFQFLWGWNLSQYH